MFKVVLDQPPTETFICGSEVSGNLVVNEWEHPPTRARISICLYGHVKVWWHESVTNKNPDGSKSKQKLSYNEELNFLTLESPLHRIKLKKDMQIPFQFLLPVDKPMPSSHDACSVGSIKYYVEALVDILNVTVVGLVAPISVKATLPFIETVDINSPALLAPTVRQQEEHIHRWYAKNPSGTVTVTVEMPHTGYHLKESIPFTATVKNETGSQIKMEAILLQTVTYHALGACRLYPFVLVNYPEARMPPKTTSVWSPTGVRNCTHEITKTELVSSTCLEYIKVQHQLEVTASLPSNKTLKIAIPITIGNVPRAESSASASVIQKSSASALPSEKSQPPPYQPPFQHLKPGASALPSESPPYQPSFQHQKPGASTLPSESPPYQPSFQHQKPGASAFPSQPPPYQPPFQHQKPGASPEVGWSRDLTSFNDVAVTSTRKQSNCSSNQSCPGYQIPTELTTEAPPSYEEATGGHS